MKGNLVRRKLNMPREITSEEIQRFADFREGKADISINLASLCYQHVNNGFIAISETNGVAMFPNNREGIIVIDFLEIIDGKLRLTDMRSLTADEMAMNRVKQVMDSITQERKENREGRKCFLKK